MYKLKLVILNKLKFHILEIYFHQILNKNKQSVKIIIQLDGCSEYTFHNKGS